MKKKIILFGAGLYGKGLSRKLIGDYDVICFADNNPALHGNTINGIPIMGVDEALKYYYDEDTDIVISAKSHQALGIQVNDMGIIDYYVGMGGFVFHSDNNESLMPVEIYNTNLVIRKESNVKAILFVQDSPCIRTNKIAAVIKSRGYKVYLLYMMSPPDEGYKEIYDGMYTFSSMKGIEHFISNSDIDIVHCSNSPDILVNICMGCGKPIVHDTHDMMSIWGYGSLENMALEYMANTRSDGNIYTSDSVTEIARSKYDIEDKPLLSIENQILEQVTIDSPYEKLSGTDNMIHCVYEGGISSDKDNDHFFEPIWKRITEAGIHIHFYSQVNPLYCQELADKSELLHYEGNMTSLELVKEMTKYDCGLVIFNVNDKTRVFLETGTANKMYEYLNSGLPVVVGDISSYAQFVQKYNVGIQLDLNGDISLQLKKAVNITIPENILKQNGLTMMSKADKIEEFYQRVMEKRRG